MKEFTEKKTGKVTVCYLYKKSGVVYQDKGKGYYHMIEWDNKDKASYRSTQDKQTEFIEGETVEYYLQENGEFDDGTKKWKVFTPEGKKAEEEKANKPEWKPGGGGAKWQPKSLREYQFECIVPCMRQTVDLVIGGKIEPKDTTEVFKTAVSDVWKQMEELDKKFNGGSQS